MSDPKQACLFLRMARKDLKALANMLDPEAFDIEIFGFHSQQAVEKTLKAWICMVGIEIPRVHDLEGLAFLLEDAGVDLPEIVYEMFGLSDFAVIFRYDVYEAEDDLDRSHVRDAVSDLIEHVASQMK